MKRKRLIIGCGYLGSRAAALWHAKGDAVVAITRHEERAAEFSRQGLQPIIADVLNPLSLANLPAADTVLFAVARGRGSVTPIRQLHVDGLRNVLTALSPQTRRVVYVSTTGVYAQDDGSWVDEGSPAEPRREGGAASLAAEQLLAADERGPQSIVLRMAGLYGPGRVPRHEELRSGCPIPDPGDGWLNLIHIDDAARIIVAASDAAASGVMNVSDGHPVLRREYLLEIARRIGVAAPEFAPGDAAKVVGNDRSSASKRVGNRRLVSELDPALMYPSYREGLAAILALESPVSESPSRGTPPLGSQ